MNSSPRLISSVDEHGLEPRRPISSSNKIRRRTLRVGEPERITVLDSRIEGIMVLAHALMREVASLKEHSASLRFANLNVADEVHRFEEEILRCALRRTGGRQRRAAKLLGMKVTTLNTKIKRYQISTESEDTDKGTTS